MRSMSPQLPSSTGVRWQPALDGERPARFCVGDQPSPRRSVSLSLRLHFLPLLGVRHDREPGDGSGSGKRHFGPCPTEHCRVSAPPASAATDGWFRFPLAGHLLGRWGPRGNRRPNFNLRRSRTDRTKATDRCCSISCSSPPWARCAYLWPCLESRPGKPRPKSDSTLNNQGARDGNSSHRFRPTIALLRVQYPRGEGMRLSKGGGSSWTRRPDGCKRWRAARPSTCGESSDGPLRRKASKSLR